MLHCAMVTILAIRLPLAIQNLMLFEEFQDCRHGQELDDFSNSESPCHPNAFHQVFAQSDLWFERRCGLKDFKIAAILEI